jgi:hypothetical protein
MNWWNRLRHREKLEVQLQKELHFHPDEPRGRPDSTRRFPRPSPGRLTRIGLGGPSK